MKFAIILVMILSVPSLAATKPLVFAHYYTWYGTPWGEAGGWHQWAKKDRVGSLSPKPYDPDVILFPPAIRDISSSVYPLVGPYDSMNRDIVRWHIRLAKAAGLDALSVDWWGPASWQKPPGWTCDVFKKVVLPIAEEEHFKVFLFDETAQFADFESVKKWTVQYLKEFKDSPAYLRIEGKPVWAVYQLWEGKLTAAQGRELIEQTEKEVGPVYWIVDRMRARMGEQGLELYAPDDWLAIPQIRVIMGYAMFSTWRMHEYKEIAPVYKGFAEMVHKAGKKVMLPVHPGHDNRKIAEKKPYEMPRRNGQTLKDFWRAATDAGADMIGITSWNEWPESTVIEPALTWADPYQYLKIVAGFQGRKFVAPPFPPAKSLDPAMQEYLLGKP